MKTAIGFDIGGSTVRAGLVEVDHRSFEIVAQKRIELTDGQRQPETIAQLIAGVVDELSQKLSIRPPVGIGLCAHLDRSQSVAYNAPNLGWRDVPIKKILRQVLLNNEIHIDNDLNVILRGEHVFGAARGVNDAVAAYVGTGLGGAVMVESQIVRGARGVAGELGHIGIGGDTTCGCGQTGCLETTVGGRYIQEKLARDVASGRLSARWATKHKRLRPNHVDQAFLENDLYAVAMWRQVASELVRTLATCIALVNPDMIVLGGGVLQRCPALVELIREGIFAQMPSSLTNHLAVELGTLGEDAGLVGASVLALEQSAC